MKKYSFSFVSILIFTMGFCTFVNFAQATTPALSLSANSDGDQVTITVNGDANQSVVFFYNKINVGAQVVPLGTTNSSGNFSTTISSSSYGIASYSSVYVALGGINGTQSNTATWPSVSSTSASSTSKITLSQTGLVLQIGGSSTVQVTNSTGYLYLLNNTNPSIANINLGSNSITILGIANGSTVATVCAVGSTTNCQSIYITVQNSGSSSLSFSLSNLTMVYNTSVPITISGGTGSYYVLNNSNSNIVQTSINGSTMNLTANNTAGSTTITVCSTNMSSCGIVNVTASESSSYSISFSTSSPTISTGETKVITVSGASSGTYYISNNSNTSIATASINGNAITLFGVSSGNSTVTVCSSLGTCGYLTVTVQYSSNGGKLTLSESSLLMLSGQTVNISISGGETPYNVYSEATAIVTATLNNNIVTVYGVNTGSTNVVVCSAGGACVLLPVTVSTTSYSSQPHFSQTNISLNAGNSTTVTVYGSGSYYISNNSNASAITASINGNTVSLLALGSGSSNITVCQQGNGQCAVLTITGVSTSSNNTTSNNTTTTVVYFTLARYLGPGDNGTDVLNLQNVLKKLGLLTATPTGHFGPATTAAVKAFQKQQGITQTGNVGKLTKAALENQKIILSETKSTTSEEALKNQLQQRILELQAQLSQMLSSR